MYPLWRHYYRIAKMQDDEFYVSSKDYGGHSPPFQLFNSKKDAIKLAKTATKENFHPLHKLILYRFAMGLYIVLFLLSPFVIGKFMHGGLMELWVPRSVSKYISMGSMVILFYGFVATPKMHKYLDVVELKIEKLILKD